MDKLLEIVQTYKSNSQSGSGGWIAGAITAILALIVLAVFAWRQVKAGKELAKLKHERDVLEEQKHQAEIAANVEKEENKKENALLTVALLGSRLATLEFAEDKALEEHSRARDAVAKITSWEDVDEMVR